MIKILAIDLDGTILNSRGELTPENKNAVRAAQEAGVLITVATGRRFRDARPLALELGLSTPIITHNGALLKIPDDQTTVDFNLIPADVASEVISIGRELGGDPLVSVDPHGEGKLLYDSISDSNIPLQKYIRWAQRLHGNETARVGIENVTSLESVVNVHDVVHISFSGSCRRMASLELKLIELLGGELSVIPTVYQEVDFTLLDILPAGVSKRSGIEFIAKELGYGAENVMAIGDNKNDLEMLEFAGVPVLMGNADADLLERNEFYTTLSNDENGVAVAIQRFILNGGQ
jgi:Cof subfamily protein (haloacid dehalogenase superfamily)